MAHCASSPAKTHTFLVDTAQLHMPMTQAGSRFLGISGFNVATATCL